MYVYYVKIKYNEKDHKFDIRRLRQTNKAYLYHIHAQRNSDKPNRKLQLKFEEDNYYKKYLEQYYNQQPLNDNQFKYEEDKYMSPHFINYCKNNTIKINKLYSYITTRSEKKKKEKEKQEKKRLEQIEKLFNKNITKRVYDIHGLECDKCNDIMKPFYAKQLYDTDIYCDKCNIKVGLEEVMYKCKNTTNYHDTGYEYCAYCIFKLHAKERLQYLPKRQYKELDPILTSYYDPKIHNDILNNTNELFNLPKKPYKNKNKKKKKKKKYDKEELETTDEDIYDSTNYLDDIEEKDSEVEIEEKNNKIEIEEKDSEDDIEEKDSEDDRGSIATTIQLSDIEKSENDLNIKSKLQDKLDKTKNRLNNSQDELDQNEFEEENEDIFINYKNNENRKKKKYADQNYIDIDSPTFKQFTSYFKQRGRFGKINFNELLRMQTEDNILAIIIHYLKHNELIALLPQKLHTHLMHNKFKYKWDIEKKVFKLLFNNTPLQKNRWRIVIPRKLVTPILHIYHNQYIHIGIQKMTKMLTEKYYWYEMHKDIREFINECTACQFNKVTPSRHKATFGYFKPSGPNQIVAIDFIGPMKPTRQGYRNILVMIDLYDGYVKLIPTTSQVTAEWIFSFMKWTFTEGLPDAILSDNAPTFRSEANALLSKIFGFNLKFIAPYNAKANGKVERTNGKIKQLLRLIGYEIPGKISYSDLNWAIFLDIIAYTINISICEDTGFSPYFLRKKQLPPDFTQIDWKPQLELLSKEKRHKNIFRLLSNSNKLLKSVKRDTFDNIKKHVGRRYKQFKRKYRNLTKNRDRYQIGQHVLAKIVHFHGNKKKLSKRYTGPYRIVERNSMKNSSLLLPLFKQKRKNKRTHTWRNNSLLKAITEPKTENIKLTIDYDLESDKEKENKKITKNENNIILAQDYLDIDSDNEQFQQILQQKVNKLDKEAIKLKQQVNKEVEIINENLVCDYCKRKGHLQNNCKKLKEIIQNSINKKEREIIDKIIKDSEKNQQSFLDTDDIKELEFETKTIKETQNLMNQRSNKRFEQCKPSLEYTINYRLNNKNKTINVTNRLNNRNKNYNRLNQNRNIQKYNNLNNNFNKKYYNSQKLNNELEQNKSLSRFDKRKIGNITTIPFKECLECKGQGRHKRNCGYLQKENNLNVNIQLNEINYGNPKFKSYVYQ